MTDNKIVPRVTATSPVFLSPPPPANRLYGRSRAAIMTVVQENTCRSFLTATPPSERPFPEHVKRDRFAPFSASRVRREDGFGRSKQVSLGGGHWADNASPSRIAGRIVECNRKETANTPRAPYEPGGFERDRLFTFLRPVGNGKTPPHK